jgi:hypothetical protein
LSGRSGRLSVPGSLVLGMGLSFSAGLDAAEKIFILFENSSCNM